MKVNVDKLRKVVEFMGTFDVEAPFKMSGGELFSEKIDASNVALGKARMKIGDDIDVEFSIDVQKLAKALKKIKKGTEIDIKIERGRVTVTDGKKRFGMPIFVDAKFKDVNPKFTSTGKYVVNAGDFKNMLAFAKDISDEVIFKDGKAIAKNYVGEIYEEEFEFEGECASEYSMVWLKKICSAFDKNDTIVIETGKHTPCRITVVDGDIELEAILAPRVSDGDL